MKGDHLHGYNRGKVPQAVAKLSSQICGIYCSIKKTIKKITKRKLK